MSLLSFIAFVAISSSCVLRILTSQCYNVATAVRQALAGVGGVETLGTLAGAHINRVAHRNVGDVDFLLLFRLAALARAEKQQEQS